jgi:ADP-sugar diphosphatase
VGQVSLLELPAGMVDNVNDSITGTAAKEMEEECGIKIRPSDLVDMTELAFQDAVRAGHLPCAGIPPSPGGCDELIRYMYAERIVNKQDLDEMRGRLQGLREHGEYITLQVVSMEEMWKVSGDAKTMWYVSEDGVKYLCFCHEDDGSLQTIF